MTLYGLGNRTSCGMFANPAPSSATSLNPSMPYSTAHTPISSNVFFETSNPGQMSEKNVSNNSNNNNNMLRKLLNDDDSGKSYRRSQELLSQLWKDDGQSLNDIKFQSGQSSISNLGSGLPTTLSELMSPPSNSYQPRYTGNPVSGKRKSLEDHINQDSVGSSSQPSTPQDSITPFEHLMATKRPSLGNGGGGGGGSVNTAGPSTSSSGSSTSTSSSKSGQIRDQHAQSTSQLLTTQVQAQGHGQVTPTQQQPQQQLAGQNPMLASMLAQTPKGLMVGLDVTENKVQ